MTKHDEFIEQLESDFPDTSFKGKCCPSCGRAYGIRKQAAQALREQGEEIAVLKHHIAVDTATISKLQARVGRLEKIKSSAKLVSNMSTCNDDGEVDPCHAVYFEELEQALAADE